MDNARTIASNSSLMQVKGEDEKNNLDTLGNIVRDPNYGTP
jgi:hypothetical protein